MIDGPRVCAVAFQGKVSCLEIQTRNVIWARDLSSSRSLVADAKNIYVVDDTSNVHALSKETGTSVWKTSKLQHRRLTSPIVFDGRVVVGDLQGFCTSSRRRTAAIVGRLATEARPSCRSCRPSPASWCRRKRGRS
jgi:outer membrane protein assembly factor BamB